MNKNDLKADVIEVTASGAFKSEHVFNTTVGILGVLTLKGIKGEGSFSGADDSVLDFKKISIWKSHYELRQGSTVIAGAQPPKGLSRAFNLVFEGDYYLLKPGGNKLRSWTLKDNQGRAICEIMPRGGFKRGALLRIGAEIPLTLLVFVYCLVIRRWHEEAGVAAS